MIWKSSAVTVVVILFAAAFWATGKKSSQLEGVLEVGFERAAFYPNGSCWRSPYWFQLANYMSESDYALIRAARAKGAWSSHLYHVKFKGSVSHVGSWGHLGKYIREVDAYSLQEFKPIQRGCTE